MPSDQPEEPIEKPRKKKRRAAKAEEPPETATRFREWLAGAPLPPSLHLLIGLVAPALVLIANMVRVRSFTIDDAYISYRYARNLAGGLGLVYNAGERIEGYTNFLWTLLLAGAIRLGLDADAFAKILGGACALGGLGATYAIAGRLRPLTLAPCIATWLLASTIVFSGYAVFGLETSFFVFLLLLGTWFFLREEPVMMGEPELKGAPPFPYSGVAFALAGLTRPEAPMFLGLLMLALGPRHFFGKKNLLRGVVFVAPIALHMLWRHSYYGTWLPNTLTAKTGDTSNQISAGLDYVQKYATHAGPVLWLALIALGIAVVERRRALLAIAAVALAVPGYVILVGGDWMPYFRFLAPCEPFAFLLIGVGVRSVLERRDRAANLALALFALFVGTRRASELSDAQAGILKNDKGFWDAAAGGTARWLIDHGEPGMIALGDIGYVGYATNYPILDMLGLVDPVVSALPGAYTRKLGPEFNDHFFEVGPKYFLVISSKVDCRHPSVPNSIAIYRDPRFLPRYELAGTVKLDGGFAWCIYSKKEGTQAP